MVITKGRSDGGNVIYTLNGQRIMKSELEIELGKFLTLRGIRGAFSRLNEQKEITLDVDGYTYAGGYDAANELAAIRKQNDWLLRELHETKAKLSAVSEAFK